MPFFDPSAAFTRADGSADMRAFLMHDWHLSVEGNARLGRELARFLVQQGLVSPAR